MRNTIYFIFILAFFTPDVTSQNKQWYDEHLSGNKGNLEKHYTDYQEKFIWGDKLNGILVRQYRKRKKESLIIIEGITDGKPNGVVFCRSASRNGYESNRYFLAEDFKQNIYTNGSSWVISQEEVRGDGVNTSMFFKRKGFYTPVNEFSLFYFGRYGEKRYRISSCKYNNDECSPDASLGWSGNKEFYGIWMKEDDYNEIPFLGYNKIESSDIEMFGFYNSSYLQSGELKIALHNDSKQSDEIVYFGEINSKGFPVSNHIGFKDNRAYYVYDPKTPFLESPSEEYKELDITYYLNELLPLD